MQFMLLVYEPADAYDGPDGEKRAAESGAQHMALAGELIAKGIQQAGAGLQKVRTARTVVNKGGRKTIHDGPFAETREELAGYYLIEVSSADEALEIAKRVPAPEGGKTEVRPLLGG
jgi:hypothetical protein